MFGDRLKALRENQGLTQNDLAIRLNTSRNTITAYENNTNEPNLTILVELADIFNVSTDYLLGRTDEKQNLNLLDSKNKELLLKIYEVINYYK